MKCYLTRFGRERVLEVKEIDYNDENIVEWIEKLGWTRYLEESKEASFDFGNDSFLLDY